VSPDSAYCCEFRGAQGYNHSKLSSVVAAGATLPDISLNSEDNQSQQHSHADSQATVMSTQQSNSDYFLKSTAVDRDFFD